MTDERKTAGEAAWRLLLRTGARLLWREGDEADMTEALRAVGSGVYIQERRDGRFYVGESVNVERRQRQHLAREVDIVAVAALRMPSSARSELREKETEIITAARDAGIALANLDKVEMAEARIREADLAAVASDDFTADDADRAFCEAWSPDGLAAVQRRWWDRATAKEIETLSAFRDEPWSRDVIALVNKFIAAAIPKRAPLYGSRWCVDVRGVAAGRRTARAVAGVAVATVRAGSEALLVIRRLPVDDGGFCLNGVLRLAAAPLSEAWGGIEEAQQVLGGEHWCFERTPDLSEAFLAAGCAGLLPGEAAAAAARRFWASGGGVVTVTAGFAHLEDFLDFEAVRLASQMQAVSDMFTGRLDPAAGVTVWPWLF